MPEHVRKLPSCPRLDCGKKHFSPCRDDFICVTSEPIVAHGDCLYHETLKAGSDHALVVADISLKDIHSSSAPEAFVQTDDIDTILERQSKAQLIKLVKQLLQKQPEVEWQLTMPPLPGHKSVPIDVAEYHDQVDEAFQNAGRDWDAVYGISSDLYRITESAARFFRH